MSDHTLLLVLAVVGAVFCLVAMVMTLVNLRFYTPTNPSDAPRGAPSDWPLVSVCIPARNEEANIQACVRSVLAGDYPNVEVLVYNDHSTDRTGELLSELIAVDPRVRAVEVVDLPPGWNGKQFACEQMGRAARGTWCLFTDADVRFEPSCLRRTLARTQQLNCDLLSSCPRQITATLGEALIIPLIHFILLSYLPMARMRSTTDPSASAGVGQFLFVRREAYLASGGHAWFKDSMHDGIKMPRALRRASYRTDLFDATDLVSCRMYRGLSATWRGFAKNAYEGLGSFGLLLFVTVVHAIGHVWPWLYLSIVLAQLASGQEWLPAPASVVGLSLCCVALALTQRLLLALKFEQSLVGAMLHPVGVAMMTGVQWHSFYLSLTGRRTWKGRTLKPEPA